jgi:hypothetical protein
MWLAGGAPMPQVRAMAMMKLSEIQRANPLGTATSEDGAASMLMASDIKRFLERPADAVKTPVTFDAPPGAPIGDVGMDWLEPVGWCDWK